MSLPGYVRDPQRVKDNLVEMNDKSIVSKKGCKILIPARYQERELATLSSDTYILGIFAMVVDDKYYGVSMTTAMMQIDPTATQTIKMDGDEYLEFSFDPGARVFVTSDLLKTKTITYHIFDEFISKGNIPWFMDYADVPHLFDTAGYHAGAAVGGNHAIFEMITATIGRDSTDRTKYYRHELTSHKEETTQPPVYVPFRSVIWNATNTTAKLLGSHASDGMTSALVHPAQRVERIEELLRR